MRSHTEINYSLVDVTAKKDASISDMAKQPFSNVRDILEENIVQVKYGTLEEGQFLLDGSFEAFPEFPEGKVRGIWSREMSGADGQFPIPPELTIFFSTNHSSVGLTLIFYTDTNDYGKDITVIWYGANGEELDSITYSPDSAVCYIERPVEDYYKLKIQFGGTNKPYRYLKLYGIDFGMKMRLTGSELISATVLEEINPISDELRISTLDFTFYNSTSRFDLLSPTGVYKMLQQQQQVEVSEILDDERIEFGTYYLETPSSETDGATGLSCVDLLGIIDKTNYMGGIYENITAGELIAKIMKSAGVEYILDSSLTGVKLSGYIPICSHREALQQIAFTLGAIVTGNRENKIFIRLPNVSNGVTIGPERKIIGQQISLKELVTRVEVSSYRYAATMDSKELYKGEREIGEFTVELGEPAHSIKASGAEILSSGANYAKLRVTSPGQVILTGWTYQVYKTVAGIAEIVPLPAGAKENILKVDNATLVDESKAQAIAERLLKYYSQRYIYEGRILGRNEQAGQHIEIKNTGGNSIFGYIESINYDLTGGNIATAKITGEARETAT